jgi:DNA primase
MMDLVKKSKLISLLNKVLKQDGKQTSDFEVTYVCPFHKAVNNVTKKKFGINLDTAEYNCFACGESGKSFKTLFKKLKVSSNLYKELYVIIGEHFKPIYKRNVKGKELLKLPDEFLSMAVPVNSILYKHAFKYIRNRNITRDDILRYNIGYCEEGKYKNRVIIPSYDKDGNLNFFTGRDILNVSSLKYLTPDWSKDFIGFELYINWSEPITLVESPFNAITIRNNSIPLFGKIVSHSLKEAILENDVKHINICLDNDAEKDSYKIYNELKNLTNGETKIRFVKLTDKDPNEIGFDKMTNLIKNSKELDFSNFLLMKMNT